MKSYKNEILSKICFTKLVYGRINKKLRLNFADVEIEQFVLKIISETDEKHFRKIGKNIYITNNDKNIRLTINSFTNRIITTDDLKRLKK